LSSLPNSESVKSIVDLAIERYPVPDLAPGTVIAEEYTVEAKIGEGLLGSVFSVVAEDGTEGALKLIRSGVIDPRVTIEHFDRAFDAQAEYDGIVVPRDWGEHEGRFFVETELVKGRTLAQAIAEAEEPLSLSWVEEVFTALVERLGSARPETHGHLGPEHVVLVQEPTAGGLAEVWVLGWGLSWMLRKDLFADDGFPIESAWRKAPEEAALGGRRAPAAQVWAIGALLYEALTGQPPAGNYEVPSTLRPDLSEIVDDLVDVALAFSTNDRFQGTQGLAVGLEEAFASGAGAAEQGPASRTLVMVALGGLLVLAIVVAVLQMQPSEEELRADEVARRAQLRADLDPGRVTSPANPPKPGMTYIPAGEYHSGRFERYDDEAGSGERPEGVTQVKAFWIDDLPFVNPRLNDPYAPPLTNMNWDEARRLCDKFGKRLCSEDEWEKACKGPRNLIFSYGDDWDPEACPKPGFFEGGYRLSDYPDCVSGYGVVGLTGGVGEWTSTSKGDGHLLKPSEVGSSPKHARCAGRTDRADDFKSQHIGMRCCLDAD